MSNNFKVKVSNSLEKINESKSILSKCITKYGDNPSYLTTLNKIEELEILLKDSYKTTSKGLNKSNKDAKQNFIVLFEITENVYNLTKKLEESI